nr:hypothetical protein [Candidatus Sigynarchaeota archaeon]
MAKKNPLVEVLEKISWTLPSSRREKIQVIITHRGTRNDTKVIVMGTKVITMDEIASFDHGYIHLKPREGEDAPEYGDEVLIPYHRVQEIVDTEDGSVLYEKFKKNKKEKT